MIGGVGKTEDGHSQASVERWDCDRQLVQRRERVAVVEHRHGFVAQSERVFEVLNDLLVRLQALGAVCGPVHRDARRRILPKDCTVDDKIGRRCVPNFEREGPDTSEVGASRRK